MKNMKEFCNGNKLQFFSIANTQFMKQFTIFLQL